MNKNIIEQVSNKLKNKQLKISFCESCTGGALVSTLVDIPGASSILEESYVTYSENAKRKIVGVKENTIKQYTVYSNEVATEMAYGLFEISHSDVCVAISGECGNFEKEAEFKAYIAIKYNNVLFNYEIKCFGYRDKIKENYVLKVYEILNNIL